MKISQCKVYGLGEFLEYGHQPNKNISKSQSKHTQVKAQEIINKLATTINKLGLSRNTKINKLSAKSKLILMTFL